ncbi:MAG: hypothetical protein KDH96_12460, partial [Candidatus Riesia sp.]|nr:hypothetical protein [Candidatus Riesia sp.]
MAKVTIKGVAELRQKLGSKFKIAVNKTLRDKELRLKIGKIVVHEIRNNPSVTFLASPVTKEFREYFEQFNKTHPDYRRPKINFTFTGELLDDLINNVKADTNSLAFIIEHSSGKHKNYKSGGLFKQKKALVSSLKTKKTRSITIKQSHKDIQGYLKKIDPKYDYLVLNQSMSD